MSWVSGFIPQAQPHQLTPTDPRPRALRPSTANHDSTDTSITQSPAMEAEDLQSMEEEAGSGAPYWQCMIAGGIGGSSGDMLMHSIDTVKTRQQGDPHMPPKYGSLSSTYAKIIRQEGFGRGLYSGVTPAFLGSFPGTIIFFGTYEYSKRHLIDVGVHHGLAYLAGGFIADFAASFIYVPSEVLKTRLQLQGRYNNPFFNSGYNYKGTLDAARTIIKSEGISALFYGYKATIFRDLPFSALQFAFYEQEQRWARQWMKSRDIGIGLEIATAASAGGLAGVITCPLDVVKTRIQTQVNPAESHSTTSKIPTTSTRSHDLHSTSKGSSSTFVSTAQSSNSLPPSQRQPIHASPSPSSSSRQHQQNIHHRPISTSSPNTSLPRPDAVKLDTSSVMMGLRLIYKTEGVIGLFRGVGPRAVWTSVQSGTMLVLYQYLLKQMAASPWIGDEGVRIA